MVKSLALFFGILVAAYLALLGYAYLTRRKRGHLIWFDLASLLFAASSVTVFVGNQELSKWQEALALADLAVRVQNARLQFYLAGVPQQECGLMKLGPLVYGPDPEHKSDKKLSEEICKWLTDMDVLLATNSQNRSLFQDPTSLEAICNDNECPHSIRDISEQAKRFLQALEERDSIKPSAYFKSFDADLASKIWPWLFALSIAFKLIKTTGDFPTLRKYLTR